jgi:hypothetical protein
MADVYGFNSEEIARELKRQGEEGLQVDPSNMDATGNETIIIKCDGAVTPRVGLTVSGPFNGNVVFFGSGGLDLTDQLDDVEFYNLTDTSYEEFDVVTLTRWRELWVLTGGSGEAAPEAKRVKFKLTSHLLTTGALQSGYATADVIDPMNSGLAYDDQILVYDYYKQFVTATANSIGIAHLDAVGTDPERWHIEQCEQLVSLVKAELVDSIGPWMAGPFTATILEALSSWPYSIWEYSENTGVVEFNNEARITAGDGYCTLRRRIPAAYLPDPTNTVCPYTLEPLTPEWDIVSAEKPTARWCKTSTAASGAGTSLFTLDASASVGNYGEGFSPSLHSDIADGDPADPPTDMWTSMDAFKCHIKGSTIGVGWLDDNTGKYVTIGTASGLFGLPEKVDMVAKLDPTSSDLLIKNKSGECGVVQHEHLTNALVWGNPEGAGTGCRMENTDPLPEVDVLASADDLEVITGLQIDANGDLELVKSTVKACSSAANNSTLTLGELDVVTDVSCDANGLTKSYKAIKYLGSEVSSGGPVQLPCTNPDNFDWEYIFNNHVYNELWWNVDYYDITFPTGCEPCPEPTGCCTATAYPDGQDGITQAACEAETGYVSWTEGSCTDCCDTLTVSQADFGVPTGYTDGSGNIGFTSSNITDNGGCSWTISGSWSSDFNGNSPAGSLALSYNESTSTWSIGGNVPSPYGGVVTGSAVQDACTVQAGTVLDIPITGSHLNYGGGNSVYNGTFRISFTQSV